MKTFLIVSETNYGVGVHVVNAENQEAALEAARKVFFPPWPHADVFEIDTTVPGVQRVIIPTCG